MNPHVNYAPFVVLRNKELRDFQWRASAFATVHSLRHSGEDKWARISGSLLSSWRLGHLVRAVVKVQRRPRDVGQCSGTFGVSADFSVPPTSSTPATNAGGYAAAHAGFNKNLALDSRRFCFQLVLRHIRAVPPPAAECLE
jgi:hypothetical protein